MGRTIVARLLLAFAILSVFARPPAMADTARADAELIVDRLMSEKALSAVFASMSPLIKQALGNAFTRGEARNLSDTSRQIVIDEFLREFRSQFMVRMRSKYVDMYLGILTKDELFGLRAFLETPAGMGFARKRPRLTTRASQIGAKVGRDLGIEINRKIGLKVSKEGDSFIPNEADRAILLRLFPSQ